MLQSTIRNKMWKLKSLLGEYLQMGTTDGQSPQTLMIGMKMRDDPKKSATDIYVVRYSRSCPVNSSTLPDVGYHIQVYWQYLETWKGKFNIQGNNYCNYFTTAPNC